RRLRPDSDRRHPRLAAVVRRARVVPDRLQEPAGRDPRLAVVLCDFPIRRAPHHWIRLALESRLYHRSRRRPAKAPMATTGSAARVYQVATKSGESSKQWKA